MTTLSRVMLVSTLAVLTYGVAQPTVTITTELREGLATSSGLSSGDIHTILERDRTTLATLDCDATSRTNDRWSPLGPPMDDDGHGCGSPHCGACQGGVSMCCDLCACYFIFC